MSDRRFAVLIASGEFPCDPSLARLECPKYDAADLRDVLLNESIGAFTDVHVLIDKTHSEIVLKINEVLNLAGRDDLVLIYYAGHGKLDRAGHSYLASNDTRISVLAATSVGVVQIKGFLDTSDCTKLVIILDCCFGGAIGTTFLRGGVDDQLSLMARSGRGCYIMTAATAIQTALEKQGERNGVFTKHLIDGIRSGAKDSDGDGFISMGDLYKYVYDKVTAESHQEPMKWDVAGRGELLIAKRDHSRQRERQAKIRTLLLKHAESHVLPDSILAKALEVLAMRPSDLTGRLRDYDQLLDSLYAGEIQIAQFVDAWIKPMHSTTEPWFQGQQEQPGDGEDPKTSVEQLARPTTGKSGPRRPDKLKEYILRELRATRKLTGSPLWLFAIRGQQKEDRRYAAFVLADMDQAIQVLDETEISAISDKLSANEDLLWDHTVDLTTARENFATVQVVLRAIEQLLRAIAKIITFVTTGQEYLD